jgi:hypothetical protein
MRVVTVHVKMVQHVQIPAIHIFAPALLATQELIVKHVKFLFLNVLKIKINIEIKIQVAV